MQSPMGAYPGQYPGQYPPATQYSAPMAPPPPMPVGNAAGWPPPPPAASARLALPASNAQDPGPGPDTQPQAPLSDTMERMLRPQGLFQNRQPVPAEWQQQAYQPAPGGYPPPGGQYPPPNPYQQQGVSYPLPPGAYLPGDGFRPQAAQPQVAPPSGWVAAPTGMQPQAPGQPGMGFGPGAGFPPGGGFGEQPTQAVGFQDQYGNAQLPGGQFPGAQFGQEQYPGGQVPAGQLPGMQFGVPEGAIPPRVTGADRAATKASRNSGLLGSLPLPKNKKVLVGGGLLVVIVVAAVILSSSHSGSSGSGTTAGTGATPTTSAAAAGGSANSAQAKAAATALSGLLATSGNDRMDVVDADLNVAACGKNLAADVQVFDTDAANRKVLLTKLGQLTDRSALNPQMLTELTTAWQASRTVDLDLAKWAQDQVGHCSKTSTKTDRNYTATLPFDSQATNGKNAFVALWNPIAKKDGLPTRKSSDL